MTIKRPRLSFEGHFTQIPNAWLRDDRLSRRAKGLLAELLSHREGWEITIGALTRSGPEGRDAIASAVHELERFGYLNRTRARGERGRLAGANYELAVPVDNSVTYDGFSYVGGPNVGESATKNTINSEHQQEQEHQSSDGGSIEALCIRQADSLGVRYQRVRLAICDHCGRFPEPTVVMQIIARVLARASDPPRRPTEFVIAAIKRDWAEWQQLVDESIAS